MSTADDAVRIAKAVLAFRRTREKQLPAGLFGETGWDFLLELFIADGEGRSLTGRAIAKRSNSSELVASRWLKHLSAEGLVVGDGGGDLDDQLTLSADALGRMEALLAGAEELSEEAIDRFRSDDG